MAKIHKVKLPSGRNAFSVEIDEPMMIKGSREVQRLLSKLKFRDLDHNLLREDTGVLGTNHKDQIEFLNEGYIKTRDKVIHVIRVTFREKEVRLEYGTKEKREFNKAYQYFEFFQLQKEFGKWLATISKYGELYEMITGETL